jgi:hypothetical protein
MVMFVVAVVFAMIMPLVMFMVGVALMGMPMVMFMAVVVLMLVVIAHELRSLFSGR